MNAWWKRTRVRVALGLTAGVLALVILAPIARHRSAGWSQEGPSPPAPTLQGDLKQSAQSDPEQFARLRQRMVRRDLAERDIQDKAVLDAMGRIPRHLFVPDDIRTVAYADRPLPIGHNQTISQPYIVALMTQMAEAKAEERALDIGTGSGYQAAVLGEICKEVYSIEIVEPLATQAKQRLAQLGYKNITVRHGDGYQGWLEKAPFDLIIVAAAPDHVPQPLIDQLAKGGKLVIPVGQWYQELIVIERDTDGNVHRRKGIPVRFVPMTGEGVRSTPK